MINLKDALYKGDSYETKPISKCLFSKSILKKATKIAAGYHITTEVKEDIFVGSSFELPLVTSRGKTFGECLRKTRRALKFMVACILEAGGTLPKAGTKGRGCKFVEVKPKKKVEV